MSKIVWSWWRGYRVNNHTQQLILPELVYKTCALFSESSLLITVHRIQGPQPGPSLRRLVSLCCMHPCSTYCVCVASISPTIKCISNAILDIAKSCLRWPYDFMMRVSDSVWRWFEDGCGNVSIMVRYLISPWSVVQGLILLIPDYLAS